MRSVLSVTAICLFLPLMALGRPASDAVDGPVLVIVPPWDNAHQIVADAGGQIIGFDHAVFGVLASAPHPDFNQSLLDAGAWAVRDGAILASLC
jgi:hypothetical protein